MNPCCHRRSGRPALALALAMLCVTPCLGASFEERLVAAVLMAEARGEGPTGMTAVAEVIANRARHRHKTPAAVVREPHQFSPLNRVGAADLIARYERNPLFLQALRLAEVVIRAPHELPGLTAGADHFENVGAPTPFWARGRRPVAVVGRHRFWRLDS